MCMASGHAAGFRRCAYDQQHSHVFRNGYAHRKRNTPRLELQPTPSLLVCAIHNTLQHITHCGRTLLVTSSHVRTF